MYAYLAQFGEGVERRLAEFGEIGQHRHLHGLHHLGVHVERRHGLGEDGVRTRFLEPRHALEQGVQPFHRQRIRACHHHEGGVCLRIHRRLDAVAHLGRGDDGLVGPMPAALGGDLIFHVNGSGPGADHLADAPGDVEGAAPAGVDVHQQGQFRRGGDAAHVGKHVVQGRHAQIRQSVGGVGHPAAAQVERPVAHLLGHERGIGVDGADHLQRLLRRASVAKTLAWCRHGVSVRSRAAARFSSAAASAS